MSPLTMMVVWSLAATTVCRGGEAEVPLRLVDVSVDDATWLETELEGWVRARDRELCAPRGEEPGLTLTFGELEATITFDFRGQRRERSVSRSAAEPALFRYQVAAAAEELVRSTWEAPPPPRVTVFARAEVSPLASGPVFFGGAVGAGLFVVPSLRVELAAGASAASGVASLSGASRLEGTLSVSWLPVQAGGFRAGPRASVRGGALTLRAADVSGTTPWLSVQGGASVGAQWRHFEVLALAEVGSGLVGGAVLVEGVPSVHVQGLMGTFAVQAGWSW